MPVAAIATIGSAVIGGVMAKDAASEAADAQREAHGRQGDDSGQECAWRGRWGTSVQVRVHTPCCPTGRSLPSGARSCAGG